MQNCLALSIHTCMGPCHLLPLVLPYHLPLHRMHPLSSSSLQVCWLPVLSLLVIWLFASHYNQFMALLQHLVR